MESIPNIINEISEDIQSTFEQLIKLVIRKTLPHGINNSINSNIKEVFNPFTGYNEPALITGCNADKINKYTYKITNRALGWSNDQIVSFKMTARYVATNPTQVQNKPKNSNKICRTMGESPLSMKILNENTNSLDFFKSLMTKLFSVTSVSCYNAYYSSQYDIDLSYSNGWKQLNTIGRDIINQTDISISPSASAMMSTALLRARLYNLETLLKNFKNYSSEYYNNYIEMATLVNSLKKEQVTILINLIATLTYRTWEEIAINDKVKYIEDLGEEFINKFNSNNLIQILLDNKTPQLILMGSYLFPLLKMLFVVFGYNEIEPIINNYNNDENLQHLHSYFERNIGSRLLRAKNDVSEEFSDNESVSESVSNSIASSNTVITNSIIDPIDPSVYEFIKMFCSIYPSITNVMGGCTDFPPDNRTITCNMIPKNYNNLVHICEYLWRFFDFSYCKYIGEINNRTVNNTLKSKINNTTYYLRSV